MSRPDSWMDRINPLNMIAIITQLLAITSRVSASSDETLHLTDEDETLIKAHQQSLYWGTYRPNLYFGTRTRTASSLLTGLMWYGVGEVQDRSWENIRHTCEQTDGLSGYAWQQHDGRTFGSQEIKDSKNKVAIKTEFLKKLGGEHGGDWVVRISGRPLYDDEPSEIGIVFYAGFDGEGALKQDEDGFIVGHSNELGTFGISYNSNLTNKHPEVAKGQPADGYPGLVYPKISINTLAPEHMWRIKDAFQQSVMQQLNEMSQQYGGIPHLAMSMLLPWNATAGNLVIFQQSFKGAFSVDVALLSGSSRKKQSRPERSDAQALTGIAMTKNLEKAKDAFEQRFEKTFQLKSKGFSTPEIKFGQMLLSNMVGGLGYFHGKSIVDRALEGFSEDEPTDFVDDAEVDDDDYFSGDASGSKRKKPEPNPQQEGPFSLFTGVPSRPFFPRGFLWDSGFDDHLISLWDNDLALEIMGSWASLIDEKGWVAREQILGEEARSKVPPEFQVQYPHFANPPTLVTGLMKYIQRLTSQSDLVGIPKLDQPEELFKAEKIEFLTRHALTSPGRAHEFLARTYPKFKKQYEWFRATQWGQVKEWERDAPYNEGYRWRGRKGAHILTSGLDDYPRAVESHPGELHLDLICWVGFYAKTLKAIAQNLKFEEDAVEFDTHLNRILANLEALHWDEESKTYTDLTVDDSGKSVHVVHKGYISLFPLILGLLKPDNPHVESILDLISNPKELWTPFGIPSLSLSDEFYGTGENYWRGPIWINVNFLILQSLHEVYAKEPGPYQSKAREIYTNLRKNVINTVYNSYQSTGYAWEQYSSKTGEGQRSHPFTGWTSLVLLIMAEKY